jgi:hypothetical protein
MNKLLYVLIFVGGFAVLYGVGRMWKLKPETKYDHRLVQGEIAVVAGQGNRPVWLAVDKNDCYAISVAMLQGDSEKLKSLEESKAAFAVPTDTFVKVTGESVSRVRVEVTDGPLAGRQGWTEFEFVRPRRTGEFQ